MYSTWHGMNKNSNNSSTSPNVAWIKTPNSSCTSHDMNKNTNSSCTSLSMNKNSNCSCTSLDIAWIKTPTVHVHPITWILGCGFFDKMRSRRGDQSAWQGRKASAPWSWHRPANGKHFQRPHYAGLHMHRSCIYSFVFSLCLTIYSKYLNMCICRDLMCV